jgi:ribosome-associated heat shock protein Hsp15
MKDVEHSIRLDKWLWVARFFKTRTLATDAVASGKVQVNEYRAKPSKEITTGTKLCIQKEGLVWSVTVLGIVPQRVSAKEASLLYQEDNASIEKRQLQMIKNAQERKFFGLQRPQHKPNKRDRRLIHSFKASSNE